MRVVFCLGGLEKGGAERVICNLANFLISKKNDVYLMVTKTDSVEYDLDKKISITELDDRKYQNFILRNIRIAKVLKRKLYNINPDIIISFLQEPTFRLLFLKKFNRKIRKMRTIVSLRQDPLHSFDGLRGKLLLKLYNISDGFVFQTKTAKNYFKEEIQKKSVVIPNPLNPLFFGELYKGERDKKIVSVGRLTEQKNYSMLLESFAKFHQKNPEYHLYIYGEGHLREELLKQTKEYKIKQFIHLEGNVKDIKKEIINAKLFVMSSLYEGLSNALMEALALGLPCISTRSSGGGAESLIDNNQNGILVDTNNHGQLFKAMDMVVNDSKLLNKLSFNAWKSMKNYSFESISDTWLDYIKKIARDDSYSNKK